MTILDIPYVSQLEEGALKYRNDCGAASGVMLVKAHKGNQALTVDEYYQKTGNRADKYLNVAQVRSVLKSYGISSEWRINLSLSDVDFFIENKRPFIVLFNYGVIRSRGIKTQINFKGSHFAVLVGTDDSAIYFNDPLWTEDRGKGLRVPNDIWMEAWEKQLDGNPVRGAIVTTYPFDTPEVEPIEYDPNDVRRMRIIYPPGMNVRSGPGINYSTVGSYNQGDIVTILKTQKRGDDLWGCIDRERWIAIQYNGNTYLVPEFPGGVDDPKVYEVMEVISTAGLNVRSDKDVSYPIVGVLMNGERVRVYKREKIGDDEWGRIGVNQWIAIKYQGVILARNL